MLIPVPIPPRQTSPFAAEVTTGEHNKLLVGMTLKYIEQAKSELEKAYRDAGYPTVLVTIPEQTIEGGTVRRRCKRC
jgi:hypothetical protein